MDRINGCESFLSDIHTECPSEEGGIDVGVLVGLIIGGLFGCCCMLFGCWMCYRHKQEGDTFAERNSLWRDGDARLPTRDGVVGGNSSPTRAMHRRSKSDNMNV